MSRQEQKAGQATGNRKQRNAHAGQTGSATGVSAAATENAVKVLTPVAPNGQVSIER